MALELFSGRVFVSARSEGDRQQAYNVLFIISDDLSATALSCYGSKVCQTPHIDGLAAQGTRFSRAYCQFPVCGPSRVSLMFGYYPHGTNVHGWRSSGREIFGDRASWPQHFMQSGYHTARVSKVYHMGVPPHIETGSHGPDDKQSWNERYNSKGPEWQAKGDGETLENNLDGKKPVMGGYKFVVVEADGDDMVHSDGKTAQKACELLRKYNKEKRSFGWVWDLFAPMCPLWLRENISNPMSMMTWCFPKK